MIITNRRAMGLMNNESANTVEALADTPSEDESSSETTTNTVVDLSDKSMVDIAKMVASMISSEHHKDDDTDDTEGHDDIHKKLQELCIRVAVCEALIKHMSHNC